MVSIDSCQFPACGQRVLGRVGILACPVENTGREACAPSAPGLLRLHPPISGLGWPCSCLFSPTNPNEPKTKPLPRSSACLISPIYSIGWLDTGSFQMGSFCKKTFFSRSPSPASFANALRPDCPLRQFRGQHNSSEDSESTEGTEHSEGTKSTDQPGRVGILACPVENTGREACIPRAAGCRLPSWGQARMPVATYRPECLPYLLKRKKREPRLDEAPL